MGKDDPIYVISAYRDRRSGKIRIEHKSDLEPDSQEEKQALSSIYIQVSVLLCGPMAATLETSAREMVQSGLLSHSVGKQAYAKQVNAILRFYHLAIAHPDTDEPCNLIAINDFWGGKFALENRKTKKRSHTAREITALLPFSLIPLGEEA